MWEKDIDIHEVREIRTRTSVFFGCGAINKIHDIAKDFKSKGLDKVIVMSGKNAYKATGAWDVVEKALKENSIEYVNYDGVTPNPTTTAVNEATEIARTFGAKAVIVVLVDTKEGSTYEYDGALAMVNLMNAAHALGVSSCWIHRAREMFDSKEGRELLNQWGFSETYAGIGNCILGYSEQEVSMCKRTSKVVWVK